MKRIFLDTNFIIDYLIRDEYKSQATYFLEKGKLKGYRFFISFLSIANFAYVIRKLPKEKLYCHLEALSELFEVVPNDLRQIRDAIALFENDFEDALQYQAALFANCDCIITRNEKDFGFSKIPIMNAVDFSDKYLC